MVDSPPVLKKGALRATGVSTEIIPNMKSAGRREPVDRSGLVGPQNRTEQPVLLGLDEDHVGTAPSGPVGSDIMMDRIQPVAEGPVGQNRTRRPVGTEGMFSASDSDRPTAAGPVGRFITHSPVGPDRILSTCDSDRPVADGPMDRFLKLGPVGPKRTFSLDEPNQPVADGPMDRVLKLGPVSPKRTFSLDEPNQPVAVGPVGQAFTPGPVGTHVRVADCKRMDRIDDSPVGSTEILDPVNQTGRPIQTDLMKIGTINRPASLGDTPPSSDSGVHSLGEQWENMSTSSIDMESEQNERPTHGSAIGWRVSDNRVPPNTEEDDDIDYPWTDRLLERESDENSSIDIQQNGRKIQYHCVTRTSICNEENSSVNSGTDGGNSDIGVLADFSDDEVDPRYTPEMLEEIRHINEMGFQSDEDEYTPQWEHEFQQTIAVHVDISDIDFPDGEDSEIVDRRVRELMTARTESNTNSASEEDSVFFGRPVTEPVTSRPEVIQTCPMMDSVMAQAGSYTDFPNGEHSEFVDRRVTEPVMSRTGSDKDISGDVGSKLFGRPVTDSVTARAGSYTDFPNGEHYEFVDRRVTEAVTSRTGSDKDIPGDGGSKLFEGPVTESATAWAERDSHGPSDEYWKSYTDFPNGKHYEFVDRRVTEAVTSRTGSDKDISGDVGSKLFDRPVKESATAWAERDIHGPSDEYGEKLYRLSQWGTLRICRPTGHGGSDVTDRK